MKHFSTSSFTRTSFGATFIVTSMEYYLRKNTADKFFLNTHLTYQKTTEKN